MKLTKGKISRLYNKKRQSVKKINKRKKSSLKRKTFRRKRNVNLANRTLKNYKYKKGGALDESPKDETMNTPLEETNAMEPMVQDIAAPLAVPVEQDMALVPEAVPVVEDNIAPGAVPVEQDMALAPGAVPVEQDNVAPVVEDNVVPVEQDNVAPVEQDNVAQGAVPVEQDNVAPVEQDNVALAPGAVQDNSAIDNIPVVQEPIQEVVEQEPVVQEPIQEVVEQEPVVQEPIQEVAEQEPIQEQQSSEVLAAQALQQTITPVSDLTASSENPELVQSVAKVIDYISDKVANQVAAKISTTSSIPIDAQQNGFDSINQVANVIATTDKNTMEGGSKKKGKRTRKFRLVKKNKTKRN